MKQNKIAAINAYFWVLKILATTLGETAGDALSMTLKLGYVNSLLVTGLILAALLFFQIRAEKFHPELFWATVIATTTVGTEISDMIDRTFSVGYFAGSAMLASCLLATLTFWYIRDGNLQIHPINQRKQEMLFWCAVLFSNSLGTAFGDLLTDNFQLSYILSALLTLAIIGLVLVIHYATKVNQILLFWVAFIFTRPFGATFGDFLTKPYKNGGLALDRIESSIFILLLFSVILYIAYSKEQNIQR